GTVIFRHQKSVHVHPYIFTKKGDEYNTTQNNHIIPDGHIVTKYSASSLDQIPHLTAVSS
ncbi:hypothetical protein Q0P57_14015, partial [Staphylococcus aureus]|nr:hypothetical protein [Staphylococcus aureus]